jgi:5-methyltetrahydropteroyltriglutamate--homocysteine methyltransferase
MMHRLVYIIDSPAKKCSFPRRESCDCTVGRGGIEFGRYHAELAGMRRLPITVIGSYPKPDFLKLTDWFSTGSAEVCQVDAAREKYEKEVAQQDAEALEADLCRACEDVLEEQAELGVDIPTDGEVRRDNYVYAFCRTIDGISFAAEDLSMQAVRGHQFCACPTVVRKISVGAGAPIIVEEWKKAQAVSSRPVKITIPGPMTICDTVAVDHAIESGIYASRREICDDLVPVLRKEVLALEAAGCKHIQIDEPVFARRVDEALDYGIANLGLIAGGLDPSVVRTLHMCCGYPNYLDQVEVCA